VAIFMGWSPSSSAVSCKRLTGAEKAPTLKATARDFAKNIQFINHNNLRLPFVDLAPHGTANGKTVFLASGFSKHMRSWLPHIILLRAQGYRVVSFDQTNVGQNLLENGIQRLERGTGLDLDADLAWAVLSHVGVKEELIILGHSRGAAVASRLTEHALDGGVKVSRLILLTPYVRYIWTAQNFAASVNEYVYDQFAEFNPYFFGQFLYDSSKVKDYEMIENLPAVKEAAALVSVLKGLKLGQGPERTTQDVLENVLSQDGGVEVQALAAEHDNKFAPSHLVQGLEQERVEFKILSGEDKDHYWPLHNAESMLQEVELL